MLALDEYEAGICECGMHRDIADTDPALEMTSRICPVCAKVARGMRVMNERDEQSMRMLGEKPPADTPHPGDGRHLAIRRKPPASVG